MSGGGAALPARLPGLLGVAIGLAAAASGIDYGVWVAASPGPGFLPTIMGGALGLLGLRLALRPDYAQNEDAGRPKHPWRLLGYVVSLIGLALLMEPLGAITTIVALFLWTLAVVERLPWHITLPVTASAAIGGWLLFDRLLNVALPRGLIG